MQKPIVFISYSHKDEGWKDRLLTHLSILRKAGILELWDDRRIGGGENWEREIENAMKSTTLAILLISANSLTSDFILHKESTTLLQRRHAEGLRIFPIVITPCDWQAVAWLRTMNIRPKDGRPLSSGSEDQIDADLAEITKEVRTFINQGIAITHPDRFLPLPPERISVSRLPVTDSHLFGRTTELKLLDEIWAAQTTKVLSLVAWGGVGKSALVNHWLRRLAKDNYRGAERVFAWSFYTQGTEERSASADVFVDTALRWFGDPTPTEGNAWDRGERLAHLIRGRRTLLILDGLEPLQFPPGPREGELMEQHLQALLRELAAQSPGLCLVSTRVQVSDLKDYQGSTVESVELETLSPSAGAQLLETQGVKGRKVELERAAEEVRGHCLALTLLGTYLRSACAGDVRRRAEAGIGTLVGEERVGEQAKRIMDSYERWFGRGPELALLRILGLFDRPADKGSIDALRRRPPIKGLTDSLDGLDEGRWQQCLMRLRTAGLLAPSDPAEPHTIDAHLLVREHFGAQLRQQNPKAWREGNKRLYEHLTHKAERFPDTIQQMAPLYSALAHGCQAGRPSNALREVYVKRICRGDEFFNMSKLGALGADLTCIAAFFEKPWSKLLHGLSEENEGALLNWAGTRLCALGRLCEAAEPLNEALRIYAAMTDFENAAKNARSLSELLMVTGNLRDALMVAQKSVSYAYEFGRVAPIKVFSRSTLASVLHQMGRLLEAEVEFQETEKEQKRIQPQFLLPVGLWGFQYCELLLDRGKYKEVKERVLLISNWPKQFLGLLDLALNQLCLARADLLEAQHTGSRDYSNAMTHLTAAMKDLRQSQRQDYLPQGLLTSAELWTAIGDFQRARALLDEAESIVTNNAMRLQEADCHLKRSVFYLAQNDKAHAFKSLTSARRIIVETGYHRRDGAALALSQRLNEC